MVFDDGCLRVLVDVQAQLSGKLAHAGLLPDRRSANAVTAPADPAGPGLDVFDP